MTVAGQRAHDRGMKRLVRTSRGWVELDLNQVNVAGFSVRIAVFAEEGWASTEDGWNEKYPTDEKSVELWLADTLGIPVPEASQIARQSIGEWRERGGESADRWEKRYLISVLGTTFGLAALGFVALVALAVFLLLKLT